MIEVQRHVLRRWVVPLVMALGAVHVLAELVMSRSELLDLAASGFGGLAVAAVSRWPGPLAASTPCPSYPAWS
ncbi:MAG: hypothetical protein ACR2K2_00770 [Mycobacteriales bacterium]